MVNGPCSPPGFPRTDGVDGGSDPAHAHKEYQPEPLTSLQREELRHRNMDALHTPIVGETPEARALEDARLANLAERTRLENLQRALDECMRQRVPESSRRQLFPPPQVYRTPIQNLAAAARIAESIQPSQSEAGRGLLQIRALLRAVGDQNSAVSQSRNRSQLLNSESEFDIPAGAERADVDWILEPVVTHARQVLAGGSPVKCAQPSLPGARPPRNEPRGFLQQ